MALGLAFVSSLATAQASQPLGNKTRKKQAQLPSPPVGPLSQIPMEQIPPAPPHVSYQHGLLTIVAQNSTLAAILLDVRKLTGASIDVPSGATERVVARLGPGPARDVLAGLLNGTSFNYVMVGSPSDPEALSALLLTAKPGGGSGGATTANTSVAMVDQSALIPAMAPPPVAARGASPAVAEAEADDSDSDNDNDNDENAEAAGDAAGQAAGQPQEAPETDEQRQQRFEKMKPPPNAPPPPLVTPPNPATPPQ
jgi:hypothetical protein